LLDFVKAKSYLTHIHPRLIVVLLRQMV
jgi:hypothetical protein